VALAIDREQNAARRGLAVYFVFLILGSAYFEWKILQTGDSISRVPGLVFALMYMPAVASVIARLVLREGFGDVSFRFGGRKMGQAVALAWIYPIIVGSLAYGAAWLTGLATFQPPLPPSSHLYTPSPIANLLVSALLMATVGTIVSCVSAFGEELGWRGYMLTRLIAAGAPQPVLVSGLIWAVWHVPLILSGQYAAGSHPGISAIVFVVGVVAAGYLAAYLRLQSGSVWPAVVFHGAVNAIIQGTFDRATAGDSWAVGESGILTTAVAVVLVVLILRTKTKAFVPASAARLTSTS
jgi:membrane protease YdiL (CAAX protease family)